MIPEKYEDLLTNPAAYAHVATIGPSGEPQNNPVWFEWDGDFIYFSQLTTRQKAKNLGRDGRIALSIIDPDNPYRYLEVRGELAEVIPDPEKAFINKMAKKYMGEDVYPWSQPGDERIIMKIAPVKTTSMG